jgi:hypothetical protein
MNNPYDSAEFHKYATKHMGISSTTMHKYASAMGQVPVGMTPNIIEERQMNVAIMDVFSRLMMDRIIFLGTGIDDYVANIITAQLLFLESIDAQKDIQIYILFSFLPFTSSDVNQPISRLNIIYIQEVIFLPPQN